MNHSVQTLSILAAATLTANRFVTAVGAVPAANANVIGVTRTGGGSGDLVPVDTLGTTLVEASAAISAGAAIATTNDGRAVTHSTGAVVARALQAATGAGQLIEVALIPN
jgi:hypothetical protein